MPHADPPTTWPQEQDLPRRPRRRLLGTDANPAALLLIGVLLCACGFIGGVLVEKGQGGTSQSSAATGLASRLSGAASAASGSSARRGGAFASLLGGGGGGRPTIGTVAYLSAGTLYVTNPEGGTVKVTTSPATAVTRTVDAHVQGIHPGETVTVTGSTGASGAVSAEAIRVGSTGAGLAALFGGSGGSRGGEGGARGQGGVERALFGNG